MLELLAGFFPGRCLERQVGQFRGLVALGVERAGLLSDEPRQSTLAVAGRFVRPHEPVLVGVGLAFLGGQFHAVHARRLKLGVERLRATFPGSNVVGTLPRS